MASLPHCNDTKERLSLAFLRSVAARCRCIVKPEEGGDYGSVDAWVSSVEQPRRLLWVQLKCTSQPLSVSDGEVAYDLPLNNYEHLRSTDSPVVQLLLVHQLPPEPKHWLTVTDHQLLFRKCTWWTDLYGQPPTTNASTVRIKIPVSRILDPAALLKIMSKAAALGPGAPRKPIHEL
ncbi:MAG TPA: DUF4365 domain-containing protein [Allosphingosinicella sp.]|jgi:hypothetical protein